MQLWLVQRVAAVTVVGPLQIAAVQGQGQEREHFVECFADQDDDRDVKAPAQKMD